MGNVLCFVCNIALNNFSLYLLPLSVQLCIRGCSPIVTICLEYALSACSNTVVVDLQPKKAHIMVFGTLCTVLLILSKTQSSDKDEVGNVLLGSGICVFSLVAAAAELIVVREAGGDEKLSPMD